MAKFTTFCWALLLAVSCLINVEAIDKVTRSGRYLYTSSGRFYIKGVAYQEQGAVIPGADNSFLEPSTFIDPLSDSDGCSRDLPFLQKLGVNTIRVYSVNSSLNHDSCMSTFSGAGIYTIIDLALPLNGSIDRDSPSWSTNLLDQYLETINTFSKYDNVLAYNVGNEAIISNTTDVAPFLKAAARDIKAYLNSISSSALVGYAAIDGDSTFRVPVANFLSCDPSNSNSSSTSIDLYGLNNYEWCGDSSFEAAYAGVEGDYAGYNVAAYFSEFGCITSPPRLWTEVGSLFSSQMSDVWSGGIAFSYFPAESAQGQFGMVNISSDGKTVTTGDDFSRLEAQYGNVTSPPNTPSQGSSPASYPSCPGQNSSFAASTTLPPTPNEAACDCIESTFGCVFKPPTSNYSSIVGSLIDTACGLLGQAGSSCDDIGGNGTTGVYGRLSGCDPTIKLSFTMNEWYQINGMQPESCSFAGNGSVNPLGASGTASAFAAETSCVASPSATFTPTLPSGLATASSGSGSSGSSDSGSNGAVPVLGEGQVLLGMMSVALIGVASGIWTLT
ncbi:carbohydrate-binding module family 43 protein/Glycoside hydrolase family 72 protein [Lentinula raphanica]|nr:glycoside hydrolase family 72 protein [Lentinula raphanica]KAJ3760571.1 carbohydrate-binding module family 43 protein/Glycoside hydrolase family 72 protein [Lentinula raphanica]KAJ3772848.1 carbohydrate-binding module family 43 protein/Glycoside hydrolase family 72 protein [Lentinula raphanica]